MELRIIILSMIGLMFLVTWRDAWSADFSAPIIDLPAVKFPAEPNAALEIKAIVDDDSGIDSVMLYYRIIGRKTFTPVVLTPKGGNGKEYSAHIPAADWQGKSIEYYVEARDIANNVTQEPFPNNPKKAQFRPSESVPTMTPSSSASPATGRSSYRDFEWGVGIASAFLSVDDPKGDTEAVLTPNLSFIAAYTPLQNWRLWTDLSFQKFSLAYSATQIGQKVSSLHLDLMLQRSLVPNLGIAGWVGFGLGLGMNNATDRAISNSAGFLQEKYPDRDELNANMMLYFAMDIGTIQNRRIGVHGRFYKSIKNDIEGFVVGLYCFLTPHQR